MTGGAVVDRRYGRGGMARHAVIVMAMTVLSGLLGVLRTSVIASRFATSDAYAAYVAAFRVPNTIYLLVIGGALGSAFIPVFTAYLARQDDAGAWQVASSVLNLALLFALGAAALVFVLAPWLVPWLIAPGLTPAQQELAVRLARLLLLQPILLGLGGLVMAILNSFRRFLLTALAPLLYNLSIIGGALFLSPYWGIHGLAAGVLIGAGLYLLILTPGLFLCRMGYSLALDWREAGVREVGRLLLPRLLGQAAFQANFIAITALASFQGSLGVTAIDYAYLLFNFPLSILGVSLATVAFPTLAALVNEGRLGDFRLTLTRMVRVVLFLSLPTATLLLVLRLPIIRLFLERDRFTATDTTATGWAFLFFVLGLAPACVSEIALRAFYALHDTRTPVFVGVVIVALNIALGAGLLQVMGFAGLPLSFSLTNTLETLALLFLLRRRAGPLDGWPLSWCGLRSLGAAALSAGAVGLLLPIAEQIVSGMGPVAQLVRLGALAVLGAGLYLVLAALLRSPELGDAWSLLRQRLGNR